MKNKGSSRPLWIIHFPWCLGLGLGHISNDMIMRISSVKPVPWLALNLHHLFSNRAAVNTQSRRSLTSYAISRSLSKMNRQVSWLFKWNSNRSLSVLCLSVVSSSCGTSTGSVTSHLEQVQLRINRNKAPWGTCKQLLESIAVRREIGECPLSDLLIRV